MKKLIKLFGLLLFVCTLLVFTGCESVNGPEGKYSYRVNQVELYSLTFEHKEVTIKKDGAALGTFEYEYVKNETDKNLGTLTIKSEEYPWVLAYNYEEKKLSLNVPDKGVIYNFFKMN